MVLERGLRKLRHHIQRTEVCNVGSESKRQNVVNGDSSEK